MADEDLTFDANSAVQYKQGKQAKESPIHIHTSSSLYNDSQPCALYTVSFSL